MGSRRGSRRRFRHGLLHCYRSEVLIAMYTPRSALLHAGLLSAMAAAIRAPGVAWSKAPPPHVGALVHMFSENYCSAHFLGLRFLVVEFRSSLAALVLP